MSGAAFVALLTAALVGGRPAFAAASPGAVCLVPEAVADGLEPHAVRAALVVEARKAGRAASVFTASASSRCPGARGRVVRVGLGPGARATVDGGAGDVRGFELSEVLPVDRARRVARAALGVLVERASYDDGPPDALVDLSTPVVPPPPPPPPVPAEPSLALTVGGGWARGLGSGADHGLVDAEAALSLFGGRLSVGITGAYLPSAEIRGGTLSAELSAGALAGVVRGGFPAGPLLLRLGLGAGYEWRRLRVRSAYRLDEPTASSGAASILVEAEAVWRFAGPFSAHLVVPGRVYLGGVAHAWKGRTLGDAPRGAVGAALRMGVVF